jgi:hypothetical protein
VDHFILGVVESFDYIDNLFELANHFLNASLVSLITMVNLKMPGMADSETVRLSMLIFGG